MALLEPGDVVDDGCRSGLDASVMAAFAPLLSPERRDIFPSMAITSAGALVRAETQPTKPMDQQFSLWVGRLGFGFVGGDSPPLIKGFLWGCNPADVIGDDVPG
jgi:hypothetical protein